MIGGAVVESGAELLVSEVGELVDALLPAAAAQVVAPDLLQVLGEDPEAVRPLSGILVDLDEFSYLIIINMNIQAGWFNRSDSLVMLTMISAIPPCDIFCLGCCEIGRNG